MPVSSAAQERESTIVPSQFRVDPGKSVCIPFTVPNYVRNGRIAGNAMAAGGSGNDIRVLVLRERSVLYDSDQRRSVVLSVPVNTPGTYSVCFDNSFSLVSPKNVAADIRFVHEGEDVGRAKEIKRQATDRQHRVGRILGKLVQALQAAEKRLGTRQVSPPIYIGLDDHPAPNAFEIWQKPLVIVTLGTLEFIEAMPTAEAGDHVLAGILGHELAHIFYRHSFGNEPGQAAEAVVGAGAGALMVHPLVGLIVGALAFDRHRQYDRMQEREADILGVRLACSAGFDPVGILTFMAKLREYQPGQGSFLQTHPSPAQRMEYLEGEVSRIRSGRPQHGEADPSFSPTQQMAPTGRPPGW